ncbi:hypothetical protein ElyMa_005358700 [Elysia marginata]|uniref:Uncharacterized protein n=1 Tax=Elysia marginata TaxID=1093978 RepID=A0AAV4EBN3_9GAST|nr:hypothetical protein ElyMa_005358700 [Elysia marginata]
MQCFTYGNKYPRTMLWTKYQPPSPESYKRRPPFRLDPTKIGRPGCPDVAPYPKNILDVSYMMYNPPLEAPHREKKMEEMLEHINKVNWSCGQDVKLLGRRKSPISDSVHYSMQSTMRAHFTGHKVDKPPTVCPARTYSVGITPCVNPAPYVPVEKHSYTVGVYYPELPKVDVDERCGKVTVPLEVPAPYPGLLPKMPHVSSTGDDNRKKVTVMGIVP